jgi:selenocysteine lyase/cysteine desulfurase
MPSFAALYALNAALCYVDGVGVEAISAHADPLVKEVYAGLVALGFKPMAPLHADRPTGIVAFMHERSTEIHAALEKAEVHVMHNAGRIRLAMHGYNTSDDVKRAFAALQSCGVTA